MTVGLFSHLSHCQREDEEKEGRYGRVLPPFYHLFFWAVILILTTHRGQGTVHQNLDASILLTLYSLPNMKTRGERNDQQVSALRFARVSQV